MWKNYNTESADRNKICQNLHYFIYWYFMSSSFTHTVALLLGI